MGAIDPTMIMSLLGGGGQKPNPGGQALGLVQLITGMIQNKKANSMMPQVSPIYQQLMSDYQRKARNTEVGSMFNATLNKARNTMAQGVNATLQTGNPMAYSFAGRSAAENINQLLATVAQNSLGYTQMAGVQGNKLADTQFQVDTNRWANKAVPAQQNMASGLQNLLLGSVDKKPAPDRAQQVLDEIYKKVEDDRYLAGLEEKVKFTPGTFDPTGYSF